MLISLDAWRIVQEAPRPGGGALSLRAATAFSGVRRDCIANAYRPALDDACGDAAEAANSIVASNAEDFVHSGARVTFPRGFQNRGANPETPFL